MQVAPASDTISLELAGPRECSDLVEFLAGRGLTASLRETNDHCRLEIRLTQSPRALLRTAVRQALNAWLAERETPLVLAEEADDGYVLRPPSD